MVTNATDYKIKAENEREVTLPGGDIFKIRNITGRNFLRDSGIPIDTLAQLTSKTAAEKFEILTKKMTDADRKKIFDYNDTLICRAVVEPKLTLTGDDCTLALDTLTDDDYNFLLSEINAQKGGGDTAAQFREGEPAGDAGRDGAEVR